MKQHAGARWVLHLMGLAALATFAGWAMPASAQSFPSPWQDGQPVGADYLSTRAGTLITNTATASFTDANSNAYDIVSDAVTLEVDLVPNIRVSRIGDDNQGVTSGQVYSYFFQITNLTNDNASPLLSLTLDPTFVEAQAFCFRVYDVDGTERVGAGACFADYADFIAAVNGTELDIHEYMVVSITVEVLDGTGGGSTQIVADVPTVTVGGDSYGNTGDGSDQVTLISGDVSLAAEFTEVDRLPSNGTEYSARFTVTNFQSEDADFDLVSAFFGSNDAGIGVVRLALCSDLGTAITSVAILAGESADVCVVYTVAMVDAGSQTTITLTATDQVRGYVTGEAATRVTVIRPALSISKQAYRDDAGTFSPVEIADMGLVVPGEFFWYEIRVENVGSAEAVTVALEDDLDLTNLNFINLTDDGAAPAWTFVGQDTVAGQIRAQLATLSMADGERWIRIRVQVR